MKSVSIDLHLYRVVVTIAVAAVGIVAVATVLAIMTVFAILAVLAITVIVAILILRHVDAVDDDAHIRHLVFRVKRVDEGEA